MKKISTVKCPNLIKKRRSGNTTRQVDFAIEKIFNNFEIKVIDHSFLKANSEKLFALIVQRLATEHNLDKLVESDSIDMNHKNLTIKLCPKP